MYLVRTWYLLMFHVKHFKHKTRLLAGFVSGGPRQNRTVASAMRMRRNATLL